MINKFYLVSTMLMLVEAISYGQSCTLSLGGVVLDRATREPLEFTTIAIQETNQGILSDSIGQFELGGLCPGAYHIEVFHLGCPPGQYFLTLSHDTSVVFLLDHHEEVLKEVVVEDKQGGFRETYTQQSINTSSIQNQAGQSLAEISENIAGVRTIHNGSGIGKPVIHGMYGNRVAIINNGLLQAGQQWGTDHAPEIDPNAANSITVIKGSDAIEYGSQALGGVLVIDAGLINHDPHYHGSLGYTMESNGWGHTLTGKLSKSFGKMDWRVTGTYKRAGDQHTPDYFLTNTGVEELNASLQAFFHPSEKVQHQLYYSIFNTDLGIFVGSNISNLTDLEEAVGRDVPFNISDEFSYNINPPSQTVNHHLLKYSGKKFLDTDKFLEWVYGLQANHRQEFDIRRGNRSDIPALDLQQWSNTVQLKYINDGSKVKWKTGLQANYTDNSNDYDTGILPLIPDYSSVIAGMYGIANYPVGRLILEGGIRYDIQFLKAWPITLTLPREVVIMDHLYHHAALTTGANYKWKDDTETRLQFAVVHRPPEVNELYSNGLHQGVAGIEEGNWELNPELSFKTILTQTFVISELFRVEATIYSHLIYQYIYLKPDEEYRLTIRGAFPVYKYTQDDSWIRGMDFLVISDFSHHLEWNAKLALVQGSTLDENRPLAFIPPARVSSAISWAFDDGAHLKGAKFLIEGQYTASQQHWDKESEFYPPPDAYFLLGARFDAGFKLGKNLLHTGVSADNLLNVRYRDYLNRLRYYADEPGFNLKVLLRYEF